MRYLLGGSPISASLIIWHRIYDAAELTKYAEAVHGTHVSMALCVGIVAQLVKKTLD